MDYKKRMNYFSKMYYKHYCNYTIQRVKAEGLTRRLSVLEEQCEPQGVASDQSNLSPIRRGSSLPCFLDEFMYDHRAKKLNKHKDMKVKVQIHYSHHHRHSVNTSPLQGLFKYSLTKVSWFYSID